MKKLRSVEDKMPNIILPLHLLILEYYSKICESFFILFVVVIQIQLQLFMFALSLFKFMRTLVVINKNFQFIV